MTQTIQLYNPHTEMNNMRVLLHVGGGDGDSDDDIRRQARRDIRKIRALVTLSLSDASVVVFQNGRRVVFRNALERGIPVVTPQWLRACREAGGTAVPFDAYLAPNPELLADGPDVLSVGSSSGRSAAAQGSGGGSAPTLSQPATATETAKAARRPPPPGLFDEDEEAFGDAISTPAVPPSSTDRSTPSRKPRPTAKKTPQESKKTKTSVSSRGDSAVATVKSSEDGGRKKQPLLIDSDDRIVSRSIVTKDTPRKRRRATDGKQQAEEIESVHASPRADDFVVDGKVPSTIFFEGTASTKALLPSSSQQGHVSSKERGEDKEGNIAFASVVVPQGADDQRRAGGSNASKILATPPARRRSDGRLQPWLAVEGLLRSKAKLCRARPAVKRDRETSRGESSIDSETDSKSNESSDTSDDDGLAPTTSLYSFSIRHPAPRLSRLLPPPSVLAFTGIAEEYRDYLKDVAEGLGCATVDRVFGRCKKPSHLVAAVVDPAASSTSVATSTSAPPLTPKILYALAAGIPIVTPKWIEDSLLAGFWLPLLRDDECGGLATTGDTVCRGEEVNASTTGAPVPALATTATSSASAASPSSSASVGRSAYFHPSFDAAWYVAMLRQRWWRQQHHHAIGDRPALVGQHSSASSRRLLEHNAPLKAHFAAVGGIPTVLNDCVVLLRGASDVPSNADLCELIELLGGHPVRGERHFQPHHVASSAAPAVVVLQLGERNDSRRGGHGFGDAAPGPPVVPPSWLYNSMLRHDMQPLIPTLPNAGGGSGSAISSTDGGGPITNLQEEAAAVLSTPPPAVSGSINGALANTVGMTMSCLTEKPRPGPASAIKAELVVVVGGGRNGASPPPPPAATATTRGSKRRAAGRLPSTDTSADGRGGLVRAAPLPAGGLDSVAADGDGIDRTVLLSMPNGAAAADSTVGGPGGLLDGVASASSRFAAQHGWCSQRQLAKDDG